MKQKGLLCALKGSGRPHVTSHTQEAPLMRLSVASLRRMVKGKLHIEFARQELTSYSGLELLRRYLRERRPATPPAGRVCGDGRRLRRRAARAARAGIALRGRAPTGASPLCRGRSPDRALLRGGADPDGAHRRQLAAPVHPGAPWRPLVQLNHDVVIDAVTAPGAAAPHDRCRWHRGAHRGHRGLGLPGVQSPSPQGSQLLPAAGPRRPDGPHPAGEESARQRARFQAEPSRSCAR